VAAQATLRSRGRAEFRRKQSSPGRAPVIEHEGRCTTLPLYEYKCQKCNEVFFELRPMAEREKPIACPECGGAGEIMFSTFASGGQSGPDLGSCPMPGSGGGPCSGST